MRTFLFFTENKKIPCIFPVKQGILTRETFAGDWAHHHFLLIDNKNMAIPPCAALSGRPFLQRWVERMLHV